MRRILLVVPGLGFKISDFSVLLLLTCFGALWLTGWRARRERLDPNAVHDLAIWLMSGGFSGARAVFVALHLEMVRTFWDLFKVWQGGIVFSGYILVGLSPIPLLL
jgi:phosphatidylglycerol---prolipoprotein diacylglyceryl transferase